MHASCRRCFLSSFDRPTLPLRLSNRLRAVLTVPSFHATTVPSALVECVSTFTPLDSST
jgi:hypothetical protein